MKYKKNTDDMRKHLSAQLKFIGLSAKSYDEGFEDEAQRLATTLRVLFHDTAHSRSLLTHLQIKNNICLLSSASQYIPANLAPYLGLLSLKMTNNVGGEYEPKLYTDDDMLNKWLMFNEWWNEIVLDDKNNLFSRKELILKISNTDGGAHVDDKLNESYANLTKYNSLGWEYSFENSSSPFDNNPAYACIRQIAEEVLLSFNWFNMTNKYNRRKTGKLIRVAYIDNELYLYEYTDLEYPAIKLFEDSRITRTEDKKIYIDNVLMKDNSKHIRYVVSD